MRALPPRRGRSPLLSSWASRTARPGALSSRAGAATIHSRTRCPVARAQRSCLKKTTGRASSPYPCLPTRRLRSGPSP
eukprot:15466567-Alexandrium_andersonii.AAC.1